MPAQKFAARKLIVVVALVAIGAAACSSSAKTAASSTATTQPGSASATSSPSAGATTPTTEKKLSGNSSSSFCDEARSIQSDATPSASTATQTPSQLEAQYKKEVSAAKHAESIAPDAIKSDFGTLVGFIESLNNAFAKANYNFENLDPTTFEKLDTASLKTASAHITQYLAQVCHITEPTTPTT
jgi:hypothetical protein